MAVALVTGVPDLSLRDASARVPIAKIYAWAASSELPLLDDPYPALWPIYMLYLN